MAKLVIKGTNSGSRLWLARRMVTRPAAELPGRQVHATADSAYHRGGCALLVSAVVARINRAQAQRGYVCSRRGYVCTRRQQ